MAQLSTLGCSVLMKHLLIIPLLVVFAITSSCSRRSDLTGMWFGRHQIDSSTDGPGSFISRPSKTFCKLIESSGQLTGSITQFGTDEPAFINTEKLQGTVTKKAIEWKSGGSYESAQTKRRYVTVFRGVRDGDTITGKWEQTWDVDGKTAIYTGTVELKKQPNKSPEPTAVGAFSSAVAVHATSRRWLSFLR